MAPSWEDGSDKRLAEYRGETVDDGPLCYNEDHEHLSRDEARACLCRGHEWDYGDTESSPVRCIHCGADGLA